MRNAISGDKDFIMKIDKSMFSGCIHSTFNRTFNIKCLEDGELYTIACRKIDNAPNTLIIDTDDITSLEIEVNDKVFVNKKIIYIEDKLALTMEKATKWESVLPVYPCNVEVLYRNVIKMKDYINIHGVGGGVKKCRITRSPFEEATSNMLQQKTYLLLDELLNGRISSAVRYAESLVGLGPGLTPSGDDFLTGLFTVMNMENSPFYKYRPFCESVLNNAKKLTNDISYMALKKASIGKVRESIISLLSVLLVENDEDLILSLNKILNIGSSSGTDIALGIALGLETTIRAGGKVVC